MQTLCRMTGWNEPEKIQLGATDSLSNYLLELRSQSLFGARPVLPLERAVLPLESGSNGEGSLDD
jgi:hypothetical protein